MSLGLSKIKQLIDHNLTSEEIFRQVELGMTLSNFGCHGSIYVP